MNPDSAIPDCDGTNDVPVSDSRVINSDCAIILDVNVGLQITHTWIGDLVVTLAHDDGNDVMTVALMSRVGFPEPDPYCGPFISTNPTDNANVVFDDTSGRSIETGPFPLAGGYKPNAGATGLPSALSSFNGRNRCGTWTFTVHDGAASDTGTLDSWSLHFTDPGIMDCNANRIPDDCDLAAGFSLDANGNAIPDECDVDRNRYITMRPAAFLPPIPGARTAIRVKINTLHDPDPSNAPQYPSPVFPGFENAELWVGPPGIIDEGSGVITPNDPATWLLGARLQCAPFYADWTAIDLVHVTGAEVVPSSEYQVQQFAESCIGIEGSCLAVSTPFVARTARWGDIVDPFQEPSPASLTQPNISDVAAGVDKFKGLSNAPIVARCDLQPNTPDIKVNISDVASAVDAFRGLAYPFPGPSHCP